VLGNPLYFYGVGGQPKNVRLGTRPAFPLLITNPLITNLTIKEVEGGGGFKKIISNSLGVCSPVTSPVPVIVTAQTPAKVPHVTSVNDVEVNSKLLSVGTSVDKSTKLAENVDDSSLSAQASTAVVKDPDLISPPSNCIVIAGANEVGFERTPQEHLNPIVSPPLRCSYYNRILY
jgi:hypothetical protein